MHERDLFKPFLDPKSFGFCHYSLQFSRHFVTRLITFLAVSSNAVNYLDKVKEIKLQTTQMDLIETLVNGGAANILFIPHENGTQFKSQKSNILSQIIELFLDQYPDENLKKIFLDNVKKLINLPKSVKNDFI